MKTGGLNDMNKNELEAVKELVKKIPDAELEKAVGGSLSPKTKRALKRLGRLALAALLTYGGYRLVKDLSGESSSLDNAENLKKSSVPPSYAEAIQQNYPPPSPSDAEVSISGLNAGKGWEPTGLSDVDAILGYANKGLK